MTHTVCSISGVYRLVSTQNVHTLLYAGRLYDHQTYREFIQLMDDDIVSLTALKLIVNPDCRMVDSRCVCISQLTLSLYLMIQCQLKLRHSMLPLPLTIVYIVGTRIRYPRKYSLDRLVLKMIGHKALTVLAVGSVYNVDVLSMSHTGVKNAVWSSLASLVHNVLGLQFSVFFSFYFILVF